MPTSIRCSSGTGSRRSPCTILRARTGGIWIPRTYRRRSLALYDCQANLAPTLSCAAAWTT
jgi:hypothetical protein